MNPTRYCPLCCQNRIFVDRACIECRTVAAHTNTAATYRTQWSTEQRKAKGAK
jgi:hypothetical protein